MIQEKQIIIRLFFNRSNMAFYVLLGETLFMIKDVVAQKIMNKEQLEIVHCNDIKEIQIKCK